MSVLLSAETRHELAADKLLPRSARATVGVGERRSREVGAGLEFADFRPYQAGDDIRYLDRHVYARLGQRVVRQYALDKQLEVTVLIDGSGSMAIEGAAKFRMARELMAALCYLALRSGDRVRLAAAVDGRLMQHPTLTAEAALKQALGWLDRLEPRGRVSLAQAARGAGQGSNEGLLIVISDWLTEDAPIALRSWGRTWAEVIAVQVLDPVELQPPLMESGALVVDIETGGEVQVEGDSLQTRYSAALESLRAELAGTVRRNGGQWYSFSTVDTVNGALRALRRGRLIG